MQTVTMDGNGAAAYISYAFSSLAVIYPITPSSPMAELADEWSTAGKKNLFDQVPQIIEMQSEGGAAGALHGAITCGALATTYTCSQGLLLMLPNMYKIAGELLPTVFHVSARSLSTHALNIFGDHQDVMACRQTGFAMLCASSVQEVADFATVAHLSTLQSSVPFLHFFDGFRTSHEVNKIELFSYEELQSLVDTLEIKKDIETFRSRALTPDAPLQRGTTQNEDIYFQNRERANPFYRSLPQTVQKIMDELSTLTGRKYHLFDYYGDPSAEHIVVMMGSSSLTMQEVVEKCNRTGGKYGVVVVRLYRPFDSQALRNALPKTCKKITVLDRTKEAGSLGEPLYLDVQSALAEKGIRAEVFGGRYGLGGKEFTPSMAYAVLQNLTSPQPKNNFTVGITDDITFSSLDCSPPFSIENDTVQCKFFGLGSDGTVGANKNSIKIIGNHTDLFVQGYFFYDSKKSGGVTVSHLRFGNSPIRSAYLIDDAHFIACHNPSYLTRYDMLQDLKEGGVFLLNCPHTSLIELNAYLPPSFKRDLARKKGGLFVIDGTKIANEVGLHGRTSTVMQAAFFLLQPSLLPYEKALEYLKEELTKTFSKKGGDILQRNLTAVARVREEVQKIDYPTSWAEEIPSMREPLGVPYFDEIMQPILSLRGNDLPTSAFKADGSVPTGTSKFDFHGVARELPVWIEENCIQCNQCSFVCPHACIRPFLFAKTENPPSFLYPKKAVGVENALFHIQVNPTHCMGCSLCAEVCPPKDKALVMRKKEEVYDGEKERWDYLSALPTVDGASVFKRNTVKGSQFFTPLFEYSYACAGCGETPYIKLLTQLFGERLTIANATGCSSIYGGSVPACPYTKNADGKGVAWANSLFEDNAEFGLGMRLAYDQAEENKDKSVWIIGGDGWAYDIGYGGLDHVLASGKRVRILVLDSEVYSNTGGQSSKSTPMGATARFASAGKPTKKKNLALMAMTYGNVYVAQVAMGANKAQLVTALTEAESHDGASIVIAYSPCIAHGFHLSKCMAEEKSAVDCGYWHLFRFNPALTAEGKSPFCLDSAPPTGNFQDFLSGENRFASLKKKDPARAELLFSKAEKESKNLFTFYEKLSQILTP